MTGVDCSEWDVLGGWSGYRVSRWERELLPAVASPGGVVGRAREQLWVWLEPVGGPGICDGCGARGSGIHDSEWRRVRDLPVFEADTYLVVRRRRVECDVCGPKLERLEWLDRHSRVTVRLAESVARLCRVLPVKQAAEWYDLGWASVKAIDKMYLKRDLGEPDLAGLTQLLMDEFALRKGQQYATVIADPATRRVVWVCEGRARTDIRPFFERLGPDGCAAIEAVGIDMNAGYEKEIQAQCPNVEIVWDQFHVVKNYSKDVVDRIRIDQANELKHDPAARKLVKGAKWLLLRNKSSIDKPADRVKLKELLAANEQLMIAYVLKDDLKHLWSYRYPGAARRFFDGWYQRAIESGIPQLVRFAKNLAKRLPGILAHCRYPLNTSILEGFNNKIKVIKRMAYGYRDTDYFFLKIRAAFPGRAPR